MKDMNVSLVNKIAQFGETTSHAGATEEALRTAEHELGNPIPDELRNILAQSDGIDGEYGLGLVWNTRRLVQDNLRFRTSPAFRDNYKPFDSALVFSDAGNGDEFFISLTGEPHVFCWNHEDDSRVWVGNTVIEFLERWMTGQLRV